jgi:hypothetical protein
MSLPQRLPLPQMQTTWSTALDPIIANPLVNGQLLTNQALINGTTVINHKLARKLQGWLIVGINAAATIYDNQATNQTPQLTLSLTSNAACIVSLWVF